MLVVGAAIIKDGRVLAAQRKIPPRWEFPGGKVEPGETPAQALARECVEELGIRIDVCDRLADDVALPAGKGFLSVWTATIVSGTPVAHEHAELRWLAAADLDSVSWMPADIPFVAALRDALDIRGAGRVVDGGERAGVVDEPAEKAHDRLGREGVD